jgi:uncharacterized membrane protein YhaH (DUF805 family)
MKQLVLAGRLIFGAWMLANGLNHFFFSFWPMPMGHEPLAVQLMSAFVHSRLIDVAMAIELVTGALILAGVFLPAALCVVMPVSTCALYWAVILDHQPLEAVLAIAAFALNGLLMLAYLSYFARVLQRSARTLGETLGRRSYFDLLFANLNGRTGRAEFLPALITLVAVTIFYYVEVKGRSGQWSMLVLVFPGIILHARRLHDMGYSGWLLVVPGLLMLAAFAIWLHIVSFGTQLDAAVPPIALAVSAAFALWGCIGKGRTESNSYGAAVAR